MGSKPINVEASYYHLVENALQNVLTQSWVLSFLSFSLVGCRMPYVKFFGLFDQPCVGQTGRPFY